MKTMFTEAGVEELENHGFNPMKHLWDEREHQHASGRVPKASVKPPRRVKVLLSAIGELEWDVTES